MSDTGKPPIFKLKMKLLLESLNQLSVGPPYKTMNFNGQRIVYSEPAQALAPPKGAEVFIGNLPPNLYEDEIIPLFSRAGPIYHLRLMMDFTHRNRGYGFITYLDQGSAVRAVDLLNNYRIRGKTRLAVSMSVDNRRLFIGNIPREKNAGEITDLLRTYATGIVQVILYNEPYNPRMNRGFAFVEFETHREAAIARRKLAPGNLSVGGKAMFVDWAEPLPMVRNDIMETVTKLYLSNVPQELDNEALMDILCQLLESEHILKVYKTSNYAFVHFTVRERAAEALKALQGLNICGNNIGVEWARPIEYSKKNRTKILPDNYCRSVPPVMRKLVCETIAKKQQQKKIGNLDFSPSKTDEFSASNAKDEFYNHKIAVNPNPTFNNDSFPIGIFNEYEC